MKTVLLNSIKRQFHSVLVLGYWGFLFPPFSFAQDSGPDRLGILLDTSGEMGFVVPRVRKELRFLNTELQKSGRAPVALLEMEGASIDQTRGFGLPARKNALVQLKTLFEKEKVDGVYWVTHFKGDQSGAGFALLDQLLSSETKPSRQLILRHYWPEQILAGRAWTMDKGNTSSDPLHPKAFPEEWLEPIRKSRGYVLRSWRSLPQEYVELTAHPENAIWMSELKNRYGLHFFRKGDYRHYEPIGIHLLTRATVVPYHSDESRRTRDKTIYEEMCRRPSIEADLSLIEGERIGVCFYIGYRKKDFDVSKSRPGKSTDPRVFYIQNIESIAAEIRSHRDEHGHSPNRFYDALFHAFTPTLRSRDQAHNELFSRRIVEMIREHDLDSIYLFTNGFTDDRGYGRFAMSLEPLASFLKESGTKLYLRVPFEFGIPPPELKRLAISTGGQVFFGTPDDPDFVFGRFK